MSEITDTQAADNWRWLRPEVQAYARRMEMMLRGHDGDRGQAGWKGDHPDDLFAHLEREVQELRQATTQCQNLLIWEGDPDLRWQLARLGNEAADIGNMAMMVADVLGAWTAEPEADHE
jgi:NTP pyrophosphatase (non-canonical NTP hydrolase)